MMHLCYVLERGIEILESLLLNRRLAREDANDASRAIRRVKISVDGHNEVIDVDDLLDEAC